MKLTDQQTNQIQEKTGLSPIPAEAATESGLTKHFGENTFYLNADGIFVFENNQPDAAESSEAATTVTAVKIAAVEQAGEGNEVVVKGVEPQLTNFSVELA